MFLEVIILKVVLDARFILKIIIKVSPKITSKISCQTPKYFS